MQVTGTLNWRTHTLLRPTSLTVVQSAGPNSHHIACH